MEVKNIRIHNMKYEDFNDNEYLEEYVDELRKNGVNIFVGKINDFINWGRSNSVWPLTFATSCCGIEFMCVGAARADFARFGWEVTRNSPRQADVIFVCGTIVHKMAPVLKRLYDQMAEPKYVMAVGSCAISGGPFKGSYHVVQGVDEIIPVDVFVPGCPPRPDAMLYGMMQLSRKIKVQDFFHLPEQPVVAAASSEPEVQPATTSRLAASKVVAAGVVAAEVKVSQSAPIAQCEGAPKPTSTQAGAQCVDASQPVSTEDGASASHPASTNAAAAAPQPAVPAPHPAAPAAEEKKLSETENLSDGDDKR